MIISLNSRISKHNRYLNRYKLSKRIFFCLGKKIGVKVLFFIRLMSQRTRTYFLSQNKHRTNLTIFYRSVIWLTQPNFLMELLCVTMAGEALLLDYITLIFYWTEVRAHRPILFYRKLSEGKVWFFIGAKVSPREPIFTQIFCMW